MTAAGGYGIGMDDPKEPGNEPDAHPENLGASRGTGDPKRDADQAGSGKRAEASTEYAANAEPGEAD
jgi:hypothetical protein